MAEVSQPPDSYPTEQATSLWRVTGDARDKEAPAIEIHTSGVGVEQFAALDRHALQELFTQSRSHLEDGWTGISLGIERLKRDRSGESMHRAIGALGLLAALVAPLKPGEEHSALPASASRRQRMRMHIVPDDDEEFRPRFQLNGMITAATVDELNASHEEIANAHRLAQQAVTQVHSALTSGMVGRKPMHFASPTTHNPSVEITYASTFGVRIYTGQHHILATPAGDVRRRPDGALELNAVEPVGDRGFTIAAIAGLVALTEERRGRLAA